MQYQSEYRNALESVVNINKSFQKVFMDAINLFMAIPDRINFLQMGRYGCYSEQTYRNNFENDGFDWFFFNEAIIREHLKPKSVIRDFLKQNAIQHSLLQLVSRIIT